MRRIKRTAHQRRERRQLNTVIRSASPAMQQELVAAWVNQINR